MFYYLSTTFDFHKVDDQILENMNFLLFFKLKQCLFLLLKTPSPKVHSRNLKKIIKVCFEITYTLFQLM